MLNSNPVIKTQLKAYSWLSRVSSFSCALHICYVHANDVSAAFGPMRAIEQRSAERLAAAREGG